MSRLARAAVVLLRAFIGCVLMATGIGKALDVPGFVAVIDTYRVLPGLLQWPTAVFMVAAELTLGAWLFSGRRVPTAALLSTAMHLAFTAWATLALVRGLQIDNCGCFGVFLARPLTWSTVGEDAFMVCISIALWALTRERRLAVAPAE